MCISVRKRTSVTPPPGNGRIEILWRRWHASYFNYFCIFLGWTVSWWLFFHYFLEAPLSPWVENTLVSTDVEKVSRMWKCLREKQCEESGAGRKQCKLRTYLQTWGSYEEQWTRWTWTPISTSTLRSQMSLSLHSPLSARACSERFARTGSFRLYIPLR